VNSLLVNLVELNLVVSWVIGGRSGGGRNSEFRGITGKVK